MRRTTFLLTLALALVVGVALAGEKAGTGKLTPAERAAQLQEKLGLTAEQTAQVQKVFEEFAPRFEELYTKQQGGTDVTAEKKKLKEEQDTRLKAIFTPEQWTKYQELKAGPEKKKQP